MIIAYVQRLALKAVLGVTDLEDRVTTLEDSGGGGGSSETTVSGNGTFPNGAGSSSQNIPFTLVKNGSIVFCRLGEFYSDAIASGYRYGSIAVPVGYRPALAMATNFTVAEGTTGRVQAVMDPSGTLYLYKDTGGQSISDAGPWQAGEHVGWDGAILQWVTV